MISIDYSKIQTYRTTLQTLAQEVVTVTDPLDISIGRAAEKEKAIIEMLQMICKQDLPALFKSSDQLLAAIAKEFVEAESSISQTFTEK